MHSVVSTLLTQKVDAETWNRSTPRSLLPAFLVFFHQKWWVTLLLHFMFYWCMLCPACFTKWENNYHKGTKHLLWFRGTKKSDITSIASKSTQAILSIGHQSRVPVSNLRRFDMMIQEFENLRCCWILRQTKKQTSTFDHFMRQIAGLFLLFTLRGKQSCIFAQLCGEL